MYQFEYFDSLAWDALHPDAVNTAAWRNIIPQSSDVSGASMLYWTEHCVECAYPDCYSTCDLYNPRRDKACRRFPYGVAEINETLPGTVGSAASICFGKWAHLWCIGSPVCFSTSSLRVISKLHAFSFAAADLLNSAITKKSGWVLQRFFGIRYRIIDSIRSWPGIRSKLPDAFLVRVINPQSEPLPLTLTVRNFPSSDQPIDFSWKRILPPGYSEFTIAVEEISGFVDFNRQIRLSFNILPEENKELLLLAADFVTFKKSALPSSSESSVSQIKCLIFDLDHTLWNGVLLELNGKVPVLRPGVADLIRALDARGILLSVASKNNHDDAIKALRSTGLLDYFLSPEISWDPKSESIQRIAQSLNIGLDTLAFVDDQPFERAEVMAALPEVMTFDTDLLEGLLLNPRFQGSKTAESGARRQLYQAEALRLQGVQSYRGDFDEFLRSCNLTLELSIPDSASLERLHELIQRTNQLNFSGRRYSRAELESFLSSVNYENVVLNVTDKFGDYGIVGYARLYTDLATNSLVLEDLALSCRIQSKRIEHAFLNRLAQTAAARGNDMLMVRYAYTERNSAAGKVFDDLHFKTESAEGNVRWMKLSIPAPEFNTPVVVNWANLLPARQESEKQ